jgi:hypothetical protein
MRRLTVLFALVTLVVGACGDDSESATTTFTGAVTTTATVSTMAPSTSETTTTTTLATTTTVEETTTTEEETTTTTLAPVTVLPGVPSAESRSVIPWGEVDDGWVVARYDATPADFSREGPWIIYLVDPSGTLYEIRAFDTSDAIVGELQGFANNGSHIVLEMIRRSDNERRAASLSLTSGLWRTVLPLPDAHSNLGTTLPTGRDVVIVRSDLGVSTDWIETYRVDGTLFASIASRPSGGMPYTWLYALDGMSLYVGDPDGDEIHEYANDGTLLETLNTGQLDLVYPGNCDPVRWWDTETILAACVPSNIEANLGSYQVLWLVELDGSSPTRLTEIPANPDVVEFGHADAWRSGGTTLLQWWGDCGARGIQELGPGYSTSWLTIDPEMTSGNHWIHAQAGTDFVVHTTFSCGDQYGPVSLIRSDGSLVRTLVPYIPGYFGVTSVAAMIPTP